VKEVTSAPEDKRLFEDEAIIRKAEKLLRLAAKSNNEAEAANATAKAMELLAAYNIDLSTIDAEQSSSGAREEALLKGGHYEWQRTLWQLVCETNFCIYWNQMSGVWENRLAKRNGKLRNERTRKWVRYHQVVGRKVNVTMSRTMAEYLETAIERLVEERLSHNEENLRSKWANSYREGVADRIAGKLRQRRREQMSAEAQKAHEAAERAAQATGAGYSTATALTLSNVLESERNENLDFIYGEGWTAARAKEKAEQAARWAEAERAEAEWAEANPEEAAKQAKAEAARERKNAARRKGWGRMRGTGYKGDRGGYNAGYEDGNRVSIDPQMKSSDKQRMIR